MGEARHDISAVSILPVSRIVKSVSYTGAAHAHTASIDDPSSGTFHIERKIVGSLSSDDGEIARELDVKISITADKDPEYSLELVTSGIYRGAGVKDAEQLEDLVLSAGFIDLYDFAKVAISDLTRGTTYENTILPVITTM